MDDKITGNEWDYDDETKRCMGKLRDSNRQLYDMVRFKLADGGQIRRTALQFFSDASLQIGEEMADVYFDLLMDDRLTDAWIAWIREYTGGGTAISADIFSILVTKALDNGLALQEVKDVFQACEEESDAALLLDEKISAHQEQKERSASEAKEAVQKVPVMEYDRTEDKKPMPAYPDAAVMDSGGYEGIFADLILAVAGTQEEDAARAARQGFDKIVAQIQKDVADLSVYIEKMTYEWKSDINRVRQVRSLYNIQQEVLTRQRERNEELAEENAALRKRISDTERAEAQRDTINRKLAELQTLTAG